VCLVLGYILVLIAHWGQDEVIHQSAQLSLPKKKKQIEKWSRLKMIKNIEDFVESGESDEKNTDVLCLYCNDQN